MTGGPPVNGAAALSAGLARSIVLRHVRCHCSGAQLRHMIGRVIGFVFAYGDPATGEPASARQHASEARRSAVPVALLSTPVRDGPAMSELRACPLSICERAIGYCASAAEGCSRPG